MRATQALELNHFAAQAAASARCPSARLASIAPAALMTRSSSFASGSSCARAKCPSATFARPRHNSCAATQRAGFGHAFATTSECVAGSPTSGPLSTHRSSRSQSSRHASGAFSAQPAACCRTDSASCGVCERTTTTAITMRSNCRVI
jgi:hypothetical protein